MEARSVSQRLVLPSMSVKRKVTVPVGRGLPADCLFVGNEGLCIESHSSLRWKRAGTSDERANSLIISGCCQHGVVLQELKGKGCRAKLKSTTAPGEWTKHM